MPSAEETAICEAPLSRRMINTLPQAFTVFHRTAQRHHYRRRPTGRRPGARWESTVVNSIISLSRGHSLSSEKSMSSGGAGVEAIGQILCVAFNKSPGRVPSFFKNPFPFEFKTRWKLFLERGELNGCQIQRLEG